MTRSGRVVGSAIGMAALLVAGVALVGNALFARSTTYRYRMSAEIETPSGLAVGTAVRELRYRKLARLTSEAKAFSLEERGEAVVVNLPGGESLFILRDIDAADTVLAGFAAGDRGRPVKQVLDSAGLEAPHPYPDEKALRQRYLAPPLMVRFRDPNDPASVEVVNSERLHEVYGAGVKLRRITVAITDDEVTREVVAYLPWLPKLAQAGARLNGRTSLATRGTALADKLGVGRFSDFER